MTAEIRSNVSTHENMQDRPVRFAIAGVGGMGGVHARSLAALEESDLVWLVDLDLPVAERLANDIGGKATTSMEEAFSDPSVDAVLVALPTFLHRQAVELAASHGKHVFCEKPIAMTTEDGQAMVQACKDAGVTFMVGHVVRFYHENAKIKTMIDDGSIGEVATVRTQRLSPPVMQRRPWFADLEKSGGLVLDLLIHELDTLRWYFGEVKRIYAHGLSYSPIQKKRDYVMVSIRFHSGVIAHTEASWSHATFRTSIEVAGKTGLIKYESEDSSTLVLERTKELDLNVPTIPSPSYARPSSNQPHRIEVQHFARALKSGDPVLVDGEEGLHALRLSLAVLESVRTGEPITFDEQGQRV
ncbi:MAG: Gfo/Idh/MocA family oxidoreductase [Thermomicrobiales bacterium]